MKQLHGNGLAFGVAAIVMMAAQPVIAQVTQITGVKLSPADGGVNVVLTTSSGSRPQVFTTQRGNTLVADIINTQLRLSKGNSFRQDNPAPGIASVAINQLDANSIRVIVTGTKGALTSQPVVRKQDKITLNFAPSDGTQAQAPQSAPAQTASKTPSQQAATPIPVPPSQNQQPEVLVPNPKVTVNGAPAPAAGVDPRLNQAPPFLPRAVAPPVGDIAISNMDASPSIIDLGTQERVPRLVLRDAPVREVLSLLARAAGLNLAFAGNAAAGQGQQGGQAGGQAGGNEGPTISLDIENEPVQDVFNYVLRLSGLEANRSGRTVFVGPKLPNATRDVVMRNIRLNQVKVDTALSFLVALGAESAITRERLVTSVNAVPVGGAANSAVTQSQTTTELRVETLRTEFQDSTPLLRGLQASGDQRTNSITLIGTPRLIDVAMAQLTQLDIRRRQVAVNVKVIDVNLLGTHDFNSSFSFGIGNNFFVNDGGAAALNFGGSRPATSGELANSVTGTPVIENPIQGTPFLDPNNQLVIPGGGSGTTIINQSPTAVRIGGVTVQPGSSQQLPNRDATTYQPVAPISNDPTKPGITEITRGTNDVITIDADGKVSVSPGTNGTVTSALPSLFQFPKRLLASLQAQVTNGNAKILTDPTLTVQEGEEAVVSLTSQVYGGIRVTRDLREPIIKDAGLTLSVKVDKIDDNGFVALSVAPTVSAPNGTSPSPDGVITLLSQRSLRSGAIRLRDGQTLILSGIIQESDRVTVSKVPILGDIPLLGSLFRKTNKTNQRNEVIVLLTPQVMDDSERSSYGYDYTPSPEVRRILERRGLQTPRK
ncbi:general secretion pathway protein GspD [Scytonema hofmannii PCC 7110]|uniref:General secretion pathway protein GspD n=1 Tax=Scytonema hofmannii PCC 7110 TaxID=128403 RepID=A0A139X416_9CYAN|nr:type IV pilus secretin family protein [Scytonema hofmannii]KYC39428.1 general secretion pathway protein GspD [Scytonema hofmannii PCC 7110]